MRTRRLLSVAGAILLAASACHAALSPTVLRKVKDAVVFIEVDLEATSTGDAVGGSGSGFVISADGLIVTNAHVVAPDIEKEDGGVVTADKRTVKVTFHPNTPDEEVFDAQILRENADLDLALLKIERATPTFLDFADSDSVVETQAVYVCGHPLGLREISIRSGAVTAKRIWQEHQYIEHDAAAESGNSGGPVVDDGGDVVGIHSLTIAASSMLTKFAIPSRVLRDWLDSPASSDPVRRAPGSRLKDLLDGANLIYTDEGEGIYALPYDNEIEVRMHEYQDFLRAYVNLGPLPGEDSAGQGKSALQALRVNFNDPMGRLSVYEEENGDKSLYWEAQAPITAATSEYASMMGMIGAQQAAYWFALQEEANPDLPEGLELGGEKQELYEQLGELLKQADLIYNVSEEKEFEYVLPYEGGDEEDDSDDINVRMQIYKGAVWTYCYVSGMPGETDEEKGATAIKLLKRNWDDPFGRLSLDSTEDLVWESLVPMTFLTPDYVAIQANTCANQAMSFWDEFGFTEFHGE